MANSPSARKRIRQTLKRTARHGARRSRARRFVRFCEEALDNQTPSAKEAKAKGKGKAMAKSAEKAGDTNATTPSLPLGEHFRRAMSELHRAAQKGALHRKAVARKVSRLAKRLKAVTQAESGGSEPVTKGKDKDAASRSTSRA